ncbi:hypothetical protein ACFV9G_13545 [Nocardioides sp. NPDC059952]|uniref:hypothetical protein n=1 Tax=Nocardioides sp. NPDC059952 TaxID=3347014 RepID=UPI003658CE9F
MSIHVDPEKVQKTATAWDTENLNLISAADEISDVTGGGCTPALAGVVARFGESWTNLAKDAARTAEGQADGLRSAGNEIQTQDLGVGPRADMQGRRIEELR